MKNGKVYETLKMLWEQNTKPHMAYLVLRTHEDLNFHRGKELVDKGYDITEVYDTIELLVAKGDLTRFGKKTKITKKGLNVLKFVDEIVEIASKITIQ
ncbi:MAG: hypothetical protein ACE5J5_03175 [Candidatus Hydrothermarchaeales archaeon]